jgi:hypothetical protein
VVRVPGCRSRGPGFDFRRYQIFWKVGCLERGPLSFVNTLEELLERKSRCSGLESREYGRKDPSRWPRATLYPQKLALTSPTSYGRSVDIVHSRTQVMEFVTSNEYCNSISRVSLLSGSLDTGLRIDGLQVWKVTTNILSMQCLTYDKWRSFRFGGLVVGLTIYNLNKQACYEILQRSSDLKLFFG